MLNELGLERVKAMLMESELRDVVAASSFKKGGSATDQPRLRKAKVVIARARGDANSAASRAGADSVRDLADDRCEWRKENRDYLSATHAVLRRRGTDDAIRPSAKKADIIALVVPMLQRLHDERQEVELDGKTMDVDGLSALLLSPQ